MVGMWGYKTVKLGDAKQNTWSMMSNNDGNTVALLFALQHRVGVRA